MSPPWHHHQDYDLLLVLYHTTFLVDVVQEDIGRVLKLDSMHNASAWLGAHFLVFNTWHWWTYRGASQVYVTPSLSLLIADAPSLIERSLLFFFNSN